MITIWIEFDGLKYVIPVNPKELSISQSATNNNIDIVGLGKVTRKGEPGLRTLSIKSFFPNPKSPFYANIPAMEYIQFIKKIWNTENINNKVAWIYTAGDMRDTASEPISMYFVIEKFDYKYTGGDFDTQYTLNIKEYKPYGVKVTDENFTEGMLSGRVPSTVTASTPELMQDTFPTTESKMYTTGPNDTLWGIAQRSTGNGNNWRALYEANKDLIGDDPNKLKQGLQLTLPENWNSPTARVNTSTSRSVSGGGKTSTKSTKGANDSTSANGAGTNNTNYGYITAPANQIGTEEWKEDPVNKYRWELYVIQKAVEEHKASFNAIAKKGNEDLLEKKNPYTQNNFVEMQYLVKIQRNNRTTYLDDLYKKSQQIASDSSKTPQQKYEALHKQATIEMSYYNREKVALQDFIDYRVKDGWYWYEKYNPFYLKN